MALTTEVKQKEKPSVEPHRITTSLKIQPKMWSDTKCGLSKVLYHWLLKGELELNTTGQQDWSTLELPRHPKWKYYLESWWSWLMIGCDLLSFHWMTGHRDGVSLDKIAESIYRIDLRRLDSIENAWCMQPDISFQKWGLPIERWVYRKVKQNKRSLTFTPDCWFDCSSNAILISVLYIYIVSWQVVLTIDLSNKLLWDLWNLLLFIMFGIQWNVTTG